MQFTVLKAQPAGFGSRLETVDVSCEPQSAPYYTCAYNLGGRNVATYSPLPTNVHNPILSGNSACL